MTMGLEDRLKVDTLTVGRWYSTAEACALIGWTRVHSTPLKVLAGSTGRLEFRDETWDERAARGASRMSRGGLMWRRTS